MRVNTNAEYKRTVRTTVLPAALAAGFLNGLIGTGGGVVMLYAFRYLEKHSEKSIDFDEKDAFASVIAVIMPVSLVSALIYAAKGNIYLDEAIVMLLPCVVGGMLGAYLTDKLKTDMLRAAFTVILLFSGVRMLLG